MYNLYNQTDIDKLLQACRNAKTLADQIKDQLERERRRGFVEGYNRAIEEGRSDAAPKQREDTL